MSSSPLAATSLTDPALVDMVNSLIDRRAESLSPVKSRKRKNKENSPSDDDKRYVDYGRSYARDSDDEDEESEHEKEDTDSEEGSTSKIKLSEHDKRLLQNWKILCQVIPGFRKTMLSLSAERRERKRICSQVSLGMKRTRSDDTNSLNSRISSYILLDVTAPLTPPINSKAQRGFGHQETARLLCPIAYPATEETYDKILQGLLPVTANMFPRFLYPDGHIYKPEDMDDSLLRGHLLSRACRHIFQGPSTALKTAGTNRGNSGNAALAGLVAMTPRMVAYAAIQVRYALTSTLSWSTSTAGFDYSDFFQMIVEMFNDDDDDDAKAHLEHFNHEVFGIRVPVAKRPEATNATPVPIVDDVLLLKQQKAAKRARLAVAAVASDTSSLVIGAS
ncbi:hypothetical protein DXG03_009179 [Asterophora parasitica]|uniref:Uncharacterized protein n=1 Tax=Asterophora parasitica TaxID=117018 RepID=A0A9P7G1J1_9AGAR|nr:hypothetical protein DXG03_009179 [Asterophora parasitica]